MTTRNGERCFNHTYCRARDCPNPACGALDFVCVEHVDRRNAYFCALNAIGAGGRDASGVSVAARLHPGAFVALPGLPSIVQHRAMLTLLACAEQRTACSIILIHVRRMHGGMYNAFVLDVAFAEKLVVHDVCSRWIAVSAEDSDALDALALMCFEFNDDSVTTVPGWPAQWSRTLERVGPARKRLVERESALYSKGYGYEYYWTARGEPRRTRRNRRAQPYAGRAQPARWTDWLHSAAALFADVLASP